MSYPKDKKNPTIQKDTIEGLTSVNEFDMRISNDEKEELVTFNTTADGVSKFNLLVAFFIISLIMSIFIPKIFISNNIYYTSREISRLHAEKELLYEERMRLQKEIEKINNKHLMLELGVQ